MESFILLSDNLLIYYIVTLVAKAFLLDIGIKVESVFNFDFSFQRKMMVCSLCGHKNTRTSQEHKTSWVYGQAKDTHLECACPVWILLYILEI